VAKINLFSKVKRKKANGWKKSGNGKSSHFIPLGEGEI